MHLFGTTLTLTDAVNWALGLAGVQSPGLTALVVYVIDAVIILFGLVMPVVTFLIYLLRKFLGFIQRRLGPMRVGPYGVLQSIADAVKLLQKEDLAPANADRFVYAIAPYLVFVPAVLVYVVIPFGLGSGFITKDLNVGLVYLTAVTSVSVVGIIAAGWASDNKWSLLGALRSAAQLVAYELPMTLGLLGPALMAGSLALGDVVEAQRHMWFVVPQALGFLVYFTAALAEVSHIPFDLPEAENEIVAGFHTEYSGIRFGLFFLGEY
ncbi:MAG: NADH-quinone oxidoreductase subunit H, partial [Armatimonadota bacterium]|nr:NADH-quinone oxidoreductase subunit H [Armatimonadota bacterium]